MNTAESVCGDAPASDRELLLAGVQAGSWRVESLLGRGGMGDVYAVVHDQIGKRAAMKVLHRRFASVVDAERIRLEGQVVNQVAHPNIVDIFEAGTLDGRPYLVMEKLSGVTLGHLAASTTISPARVIQILTQVCHAVAAAHGAGVIHRDLKPDNIFLTSTIHDSHALHVKVLDWGIAKVLADTSRRTREGQLVGTPEYISPEQACGRSVSPQSDVYALGVIAYELFLHRLPFDAHTPLDMLKAHFEKAPRPPRELWPDMPARLETLVLAMLAKEPRERPTIIGVFEALQQVTTELAPDSRPSLSHGSMPDAHALTVQAEITVRRVKHWELALLFVVMVVLLWVVLAIAVTAHEAQTTTSRRPSTPTAHIALPPMPMVPAASPRVAVVVAPSPIVSVPSPIVVAPPPVSRLHPRARRVEITPAPSTPRQALLADSAAGLASHYVSVGRELKVHGDAHDIEVSDLWSRYRRIRFNQALMTPETRAEATRELSQIQDAILDRCSL